MVFVAGRVTKILQSPRILSDVNAAEANVTEEQPIQNCKQHIISKRENRLNKEGLKKEKHTGFVGHDICDLYITTHELPQNVCNL